METLNNSFVEEHIEHLNLRLQNMPLVRSPPGTTSQEPEPGKTEEAIANQQFKQFDIVTDYSDHHFRNSNSKVKEDNCFNNATSVVHKKIMEEWKILQENLPESIYIRVYEGRIDLLRAVIIGAAGTPYHDGLFFFDLAFPSDYPNNPPQVTYHAHGLRLNPNLYKSGYVCLSLLNTWDGDKEEVWDPSASTILQVLVSLQALVLNEEPFFNEPGYEKVDGDSDNTEESVAYNDNVFVLSCKTMQYLLQNPPKNFEGFVADHFRERARVILTASKAYMDGQFRVGRYQRDGCPSTSTVEVSAEFKSSMEAIYPNLVQAFTGVGASLQDIVQS